MSNLFAGIVLIALAAGAYFLFKLILAFVRSQPKGEYFKRLGVTAVVLVVATIGGTAASTSEKPTTNESKKNIVVAEKPVAESNVDADEKLAELEKKLAEVKVAEDKPGVDKKVIAEPEKTQPVEKPKTKEDEDFEKNYAKLNEESKAFYEKTYQELIEKEGLFSKHAYTEKEAREEAMTRALNKQKDADKAADDSAKEQSENLAKAKKELSDFEREHSVVYDNLGNDTYNVTITFRHGSIYTKIKDNSEYYTKDDQETMYMARECTQIVQMFNEAGIKVNHFTINMTGDVIDTAGNKWKDTIAIVEFDNQKFPKNDFRSFYAKCSRFWVMESK